MQKNESIYFSALLQSLLQNKCYKACRTRLGHSYTIHFNSTQKNKLLAVLCHIHYVTKASMPVLLDSFVLLLIILKLQVLTFYSVKPKGKCSWDVSNKLHNVSSQKNECWRGSMAFYLFVVSLSEARKKIYSKCCTYFCFALNNCVCAHVDLNCGYFSISVAFSIATVLIAMLSF